MKRLALLSLLAVFLALGAATSARADVTMQIKQNGTLQQLCLKPDRFAASTPEGAVIFRGDKKILWNVNTLDKTCAEMTEADAKAAGEKVGAAMSQMQESMKNLPPEQRAMMEKMMAGRMPQAAPEPQTVKATGERKVVNNFACAGYLVTRGDGTTAEVWAADPADVHLDPADLAVFAQFAEFMKALVGGMNLDSMREMVKDYAHPAPGDVPGFAVLTILKDRAGKETGRIELVKVDREPVPAATFEVPAGFKTTKLMPAGAGGGK